MGRTPDPELVERAKTIQESYQGTLASDAIRIVVKFDVKEGGGDDGGDNSSQQQPMISFGSADFSFYYDADIIVALKMVPPSLRTYDPATKIWSVELLALPHALEYLTEIGYTSPPPALKEISEHLAELDAAVHDKMNGDDDTSNDTTASSQQLDQKNNTLQNTTKKIVTILKQSNKAEESQSIDRSDYGQAKQRRLTLSQIEYSMRYNNDYDCSEKREYFAS
ncbi:MAG: hypothetical protein SGARI_000812 [Bacillariaceae sp.]